MILTDWEWVCGGTLESATFAVKVICPAVVGVPVRVEERPVEAAADNHIGRLV